MADDVLVQDERRSGCPVIHLDTSADRPVGEWSHDLNRLREGAPIYWNEHNQCWVLTRAKHVREVFQDPVVFTNDSISPGDPDPAYKWIPSNVNPPQHVQYRQILNHAFGPAPVGRVGGQGPPLLRDGDRRGRTSGARATTSPTSAASTPPASSSS